jgi:type I restriction enzyme, S subunit
MAGVAASSSPPAWTEARLGDVAEISSGGPAPQRHDDFGGTNPFVRVSHLGDNHRIRGCDWITDEAVARHRLKLFPRGTIVLPKSGASIRLEKRAILPFDSYVVSHLATVRASGAVDTDFLFFSLIRRHFADGKADGYPTLRVSEIRDAEIVVPPLAEQRAIARVLSTIRRGQEAERRSRQPMSLVRDALIGRCFEAVEANHRLNDLLAEPLRNGYSPRESQAGNTRVLTLSAITLHDFSEKNTKLFTPQRPIGQFWLEPGDILIERANTRELVGTAALYSGARHWAIFPDLTTRVRVDPDLMLPEVMEAFLSTREVRRYFSSASRGTAGSMPKIDHRVIGELRVRVPTRLKQQDLAHQLKALDRSARASANRALSLDTVFQLTSEALLSGRRRLQ